MEQILALIRQNPFFSAVSVIGTAVSITFVMVIYMVYDIRTADLAPESHRSSMVYSSYGYSYRKSDHSNSNTGMSYRAVNAIFAELPGAELVTYLGPTYLRYCGDSPVRGMRRTVRQVDLNYWRVYDIPLVAGRLFQYRRVRCLPGCRGYRRTACPRSFRVCRSSHWQKLFCQLSP
ncbi:ABC transporter permease [Bacteroides uniformis]|nr:ABC transporter permease [Bacteroides uniformis]